MYNTVRFAEICGRMTSRGGGTEELAFESVTCFMDGSGDKGWPCSYYQPAMPRAFQKPLIVEPGRAVTIFMPVLYGVIEYGSHEWQGSIQSRQLALAAFQHGSDNVPRKKNLVFLFLPRNTFYTCSCLMSGQTFKAILCKWLARTNQEAAVTLNSYMKAGIIDYLTYCLLFLAKSRYFLI